MQKISLTFLLTILCLSSLFSEGYRGRVFVDSNKNNVWDQGEQTLPNVAVSNGLEVTKTDDQGLFVLPVREGAKFIFITTPSGYLSNNAFYRSINKETSSYDIALQPWTRWQRKDGSHHFIQLSDSEIASGIHEGIWSNNIRDYAFNEKAAFIIHTGDICYESGLKSHIKLMNTENMRCPTFYCIGNHDLVKGDYGEQLYESLYGPVYYSFDFNDIHYIVTPMLSGDYQPKYTKRDVYEWLKNDLAMVKKGQPIIVFNHDLLTSGDRFIYEVGPNEKIDLDTFNLKAWLYGHWHNHYVRKQGKVLSILTSAPDKGGIDHATSAFRVVEVDSKGELKTDLRYTHLDKKITISSVHDESSPVKRDGRTPLSVNTYHSASKTKEVTISCSSENESLDLLVPLKKQTDWNWYEEIKIPEVYDGKRIFITAKATFENGENTSTTSSFIYKGRKDALVKLGDEWHTLRQNSSHHVENKADELLSLSLSWLANVKGNIFLSSPVIANNMLYIATLDEDLRGEGGVTALDAISGERIWSYRTRNSIKNSIAHDRGLIFAQDAEGYLYAIDAKSGQLAWEKRVISTGFPVLTDGLTASDGIVYAGIGNSLSAYNGKTGALKWKNSTLPQGEAGSSTITVAGRVVIVGINWRALYGIDKETGKTLWERKDKGLVFRDAAPLYYHGRLYLTSGAAFFVMDPLTGEIIVEKSTPYNLKGASVPLITDQLIVFGSGDNGLIAWDRYSFEEQWRSNASPAMIYTAPYTRPRVTTVDTSPVLAGETIYFASSDGNIYGVNRATGVVTWTHHTGVSLFSSLAISGNTLFAADYGGNVYAFSGYQTRTAQ